MVKSISIPKTPRSAYNPKRRVSGLLKAHIANIEAAALQKLGAKPFRKPRTEGQASAYIAELTAALHPEGVVAPAGLTPAVAQPPARVRDAKLFRVAKAREKAPARAKKRRKANTARGARKLKR